MNTPKHLQSPDNESEWVIIFGCGKYGKIAWNHFKGRANVILLDQDLNALKNLSDELKIFPKDHIKEALKVLKKLNYPQSRSTHRGPKPQENAQIGLEGGLNIFSKIIELGIPAYIVPTAPIHIMGNFFKYLLIEKGLKIKNNDLNDFKTSLQRNKPQNLRYFIEENTAYFSYAPINRSCPENCVGPEDYCPYHKLKKPKTVTKFIAQIFSGPRSYLFQSKQLKPGLGAISGKELQKNLDILRNLNYETGQKIIVSTTCNCHGILERFSIQSKHF